MPRPPSRPTRDQLLRERDALRRRVAELEGTAGELSADRLRETLAAARAGVWEWDMRTNRVTWTDENCRLLGYAPGSVTPTFDVWLGCIHPDDRPATEAAVRKAVAERSGVEIIHRVVWPDGSVHWLRDVGQMVFDAEGKPAGMFGVQFDITRQKETEADLREADARFRALVENVPGAVYRCEADFPYRDLALSEGIRRITGYGPEEHLRSDRPALGEMTVPEDREMVDRAVADARQRRGTFDVTYRIRRADGSIRWVHEQGRVACDAAGEPRWLEGVLLDVTAERESAEVLRAQEERLRAIVENEPECVKLLDVAGNLLEMNPAGLAMIEADTLEQVRGRCVCPIVVPEDEPAFREMLAAVFAGETRTLVFDVVGLKGTRRTLETHAVPLREGPSSGPGGVQALLGVSRDITARRQAEAALRQSEARYRTLVDSVPGAVFLCEVLAPWRDTFMSEGVRAITGYGPGEFVRPGGVTFHHLVLPEDRPPAERIVEAAIARGEPYELHYRIRHAGGSIRWVHEQGRAAHGPDGRPVFLGGVMLDVTDRMRGEEAIRASEARMLEAQRIAGVGSWDLDLTTGALVWSVEHFRIFELDLERFPATYEAFLQAVHPDDRAMVDAAYAESVERRTPFDVAHRLLMPDGRVKYVHERGVTFYDEQGRPVRSTGTVQDITERRVAEEARAALETRLLQAQKMEAIGTLAGGIAHDFNNILAAILGHTELLARELPAGSPGEESVAGILAASHRAKDLVTQILTFSRRSDQSRRAIPLARVVREAVQLLRASLPATIEIRMEIAEENALVLADPTQIHQVMMNLCTNAAHAMRDQGGVLQVACGVARVTAAFARRHPGLHPGRYVRLTVRDAGHGMSDETLGRIFDPFFSTKPPGEGTGLGLAVVHGIMQAHDGAIIVDSAPGGGTTFHLYFPVVEGAAPVEVPAEPVVARGRGERLLVVDDEPALVSIACRLLRQLDYRVTGHTDPQEALAEFERRPAEFDLVLCDLTMPGMTGLQLCRRMLALRPELPILLVSGYAGSLDRVEVRRAGVRELITKPYDTQHLAGVLRTHLSTED